MKKYYFPLLITIIIFLIISNIILFIDTQQQLAYYKDINNGITFIWNDDEESIPVDSTPIMLEYTDEDTVYLGPLITNLSEYQFTITDDSISVYDFDRYVGTVKLEGQLEKLLIKDNE